MDLLRANLAGTKREHPDPTAGLCQHWAFCSRRDSRTIFPPPLALEAHRVLSFAPASWLAVLSDTDLRDIGESNLTLKGRDWRLVLRVTPSRNHDGRDKPRDLSTLWALRSVSGPGIPP